MPGWLSWLSGRLRWGHDLVVREFEPRVGLCADSSEPAACFRFCVSLSLTLPHSCSVSSNCVFFSFLVCLIIFFLIPGYHVLGKNNCCKLVFSNVVARCGAREVFYSSFFFFTFIYFWETETQHKWGRGRERGRHRIGSRLQALSCQHRASCRAWTHGVWDHDLSRSQIGRASCRERVFRSV